MNTAKSAAADSTPKTNPKVRPVTIGLPEGIYRRVRILCASRDQTLGSFFTGLCEAAVGSLKDELADVMPATRCAGSTLESALSGLVTPDAAATDGEEVAS